MTGLLSARKLQSGQQNFRSAFKFTMNVKMQQKRTAGKFSAVLLHTLVFVPQYPECRSCLQDPGRVSVRHGIQEKKPYPEEEVLRSV